MGGIFLKLEIMNRREQMAEKASIRNIEGFKYWPEKSKEEVIERLLTSEEKLLKATQNLGHPAYGHSSSTTFAIDELREENFDYLGVEKK